MTEIPEIDVKDLAKFTIYLKIKRMVSRKFYKLDEAFDLEEYLGKEIYNKLSEKDFQELEEKIIDEWRSLDDKNIGEIQLEILSKIGMIFPAALSPPIHHKRFGKTGDSKIV